MGAGRPCGCPLALPSSLGASSGSPRKRRSRCRPCASPIVKGTAERGSWAPEPAGASEAQRCPVRCSQRASAAVPAGPAAAYTPASWQGMPSSRPASAAAPARAAGSGGSTGTSPLPLLSVLVLLAGRGAGSGGLTGAEACSCRLKSLMTRGRQAKRCRWRLWRLPGPSPCCSAAGAGTAPGASTALLLPLPGPPRSPPASASPCACQSAYGRSSGWYRVHPQ